MIGPHFWYDLIRLPRKGWSTFFRVLYLVVLLIGLWVMYEGNRHSIGNLAGYAAFAQAFAYTLIVMQDILVLVLLPVYVGSAIAEERENQTLEALFITPLTNRQIVQGKFGGRFLHLMAVVLAGVPLLAFTHMWGNVSITLLFYHTANTVLLAMSASSVCIFVSSRSTTVFQAVTSSYPLVFIAALISQLVAYGLPFAIRDLSWNASYETAIYLLILAGLAVGHLLFTRFMLHLTMSEMTVLRRLDTKPKPQQQSKAFSLADKREPTPIRTRKGKVQGSFIHRLALPITEPALFWKECLKDGTQWSLTFAWLGFFVLGVAVVCLLCQPVISAKKKDFDDVRVMTSAFAYTSYFIGLAAYFLVVIFQTTVAVAGERERNTLEFLLLLPVHRREIILCKWLGPFWKNWPILAVSYLGVLLGLGTRVYSPTTALVLFVLPWPFLLMCSFVGLLLSVLCRRTLYANIVMAGFLLMLIVVHFLGAQYFTGLFPAYSRLLFQTDLSEFDHRRGVRIEPPWMPLVFAEQGIFLLVAVVCALLAYYLFHKTDYQGKM